MNVKGISSFFIEPGTVDSMRCGACGAVCDVERGVDTYTSMFSAMQRKTRRVDKFLCPHVGADWHDLAVRLVQAIAETPSRRLAALMHQDLEDVLLAANVEGVSFPARGDDPTEDSD